MNESQKQAVESFRRFVEQQHITGRPAEYGAKITEWEVSATEYGTLWIKAQVELTGLPEGNLLRAIDHEHYFVSVGRRGALTMRMGPRSLRQFEGKQFLGINIRLGA